MYLLPEVQTQAKKDLEALLLNARSRLEVAKNSTTVEGINKDLDKYEIIISTLSLEFRS